MIIIAIPIHFLLSSYSEFAAFTHILSATNKFSHARAGLSGTDGLEQFRGKINNYVLDSDDTYKVWVKLRVEIHVQGTGATVADFGGEDNDFADEPGDPEQFVQINEIIIDKDH
ncbi:hypothetical protein ACERIM_06830 [Natrinema sp. H-ect1]|uniref:hypothetical protein n=1 Tax=Natrinema sp. H-ect1 TaxID=3242700 RepID=UPI00359D30AD